MLKCGLWMYFLLTGLNIYVQATLRAATLDTYPDVRDRKFTSCTSAKRERKRGEREKKRERERDAAVRKNTPSLSGTSCLCITQKSGDWRHQYHLLHASGHRDQMHRKCTSKTKESIFQPSCSTPSGSPTRPTPFKVTPGSPVSPSMCTRSESTQEPPLALLIRNARNARCMSLR
jgi:hypothetical protein